MESTATPLKERVLWKKSLSGAVCQSFTSFPVKGTGVGVGTAVAVGFRVGVAVSAVLVAVGAAVGVKAGSAVEGGKVAGAVGEEAQAVKRSRHSKSRLKPNHSFLNRVFFIKPAYPSKTHWRQAANKPWLRFL